MTDNRASRLRERRHGNQGAPDEESEDSSSDSVKEERVGTYMYLAEEQKDEVQHQYNLLKAEFEYEFDAEFEKNRHFYPLLVQHGLDGLDDLDAREIQTRLYELDVQNSA